MGGSGAVLQTPGDDEVDVKMETIIVAILGSGALSALISGIFGLIQNRKSKQAKIEKELKDIREAQDAIRDAQKLSEKDALRTQLLVMIKEFPQETTDILRLAEHYFKDLGGNWVLTDIFAGWAKIYGIEIPKWFKEDI